KINELNIVESMKEIRKALLDADVNYKIAKEFTQSVKDKALGQEVLQSLQPGQLMVKIVRDELALLMGSSSTDISLKPGLTVVLMAGLQGSGKTTFSGKLANYLKNKKTKKPLLVACDVYRPAAIDQLHIVGDQLGITVFSDREQKDPVLIAKEGLAKAKAEGFNVLIVDTAGRLALDEAMMSEIKAIKDAIDPDETLFVVDAMTGQDAVNTAKAFNDVLDFDGVVLTKLDGDTRGGAALTIRSVVNKPIKFGGTGEKLDALDVFYPDRMADRILGMGDVVSLVERAQEQFDEDEARKIQKKIAKETFGFDDFLSQIQQIKKMGPMKDLVSMIPGMAKATKGLDMDDDAFKYIEAMIYSMTPLERSQPKLIDASRKKRIANGSGRDVQELNKLIKQFDQMSKMMKTMQGAKGRNMMQMMQNMKTR
ncbi:MAG: signal recognition particle protein, partial [Bacteroidetes bacterium]|nr:signal recognition particle protein [Bacteroidota bacterium]